MRFARRHLVEALDQCRLLHAQGLASTIGLWSRVEHCSAEVAEEYLASLQALGEAQADMDCYVSIKPLALAFRRDLLMTIAAYAREVGIRLHFDSPSAELADITLSAAEEALGANGAIGCTLPGRWCRSLDDADWAIARDLTVRVVKGQWSDPDDPRHDARRGFLTLVERLAGRARHVAVATHDAALAGEAIALLRAAGTSCELELLVEGPADAALRVAQASDTCVRGYIAYGDGECLYKPDVTRPGRAPLASWPPPWLQFDARARA